jgi:hypothetical protein
MVTTKGQQSFVGCYNGYENFKWKETTVCPNKQHFWDGHSKVVKIKYAIEKEK